MTRPTRFLALSLLLLAGCGEEQGTLNPSAAEGALDLQFVNGEELLADIRGNGADVTVLNAWATWCAPCVVEFPGYVAYSREAPDNVAVRFVAVADDEAAVRAFLADHEVGGASYFIPLDASTQIDAIDPRWDGGIPVTFLFDRQGNVIDAWSGAATQAQLASRVDEALEFQNQF